MIFREALVTERPEALNSSVLVFLFGSRYEATRPMWMSVAMGWRQELREPLAPVAEMVIFALPNHRSGRFPEAMVRSRISVPYGGPQGTQRASGGSEQ